MEGIKQWTKSASPNGKESKLWTGNHSTKKNPIADTKPGFPDCLTRTQSAPERGKLSSGQNAELWLWNLQYKKLTQNEDNYGCGKTCQGRGFGGQEHGHFCTRQGQTQTLHVQTLQYMWKWSGAGATQLGQRGCRWQRTQKEGQVTWRRVRNRRDARPQMTEPHYGVTGGCQCATCCARPL